MLNTPRNFKLLAPLDVDGGMRKVCWAAGWPSDGHLLGDDGGPRWSVGVGWAKTMLDKTN